MPQICDVGQTALHPLRRKACCGFFCPKNPTVSAGFDPAILGTRGHRSRSCVGVIASEHKSRVHLHPKLHMTGGWVPLPPVISVSNNKNELLDGGGSSTGIQLFGFPTHRFACSLDLATSIYCIPHSQSSTFHVVWTFLRWLLVIL
jgi:hypothetical protein